MRIIIQYFEELGKEEGILRNILRCEYQWTCKTPSMMDNHLDKKFYHTLHTLYAAMKRLLYI